MTRIFTGHALAGRIHNDIREGITRLGRAPRCAVLIDEASAPMVAYASRQREAAAKLGIELAFASYERSPELARDQLRRLGEDPRLDAVMTLYPGDVIATGTPEGVGPVVDGDRIRIVIDRIGEMNVDVVQGDLGMTEVFAQPYVPPIIKQA